MLVVETMVPTLHRASPSSAPLTILLSMSACDVLYLVVIGPEWRSLKSLRTPLQDY